MGITVAMSMRVITERAKVPSKTLSAECRSTLARFIPNTFKGKRSVSAPNNALISSNLSRNVMRHREEGEYDEKHNFDCGGRSRDQFVLCNFFCAVCGGRLDCAGPQHGSSVGAAP